MRAEGCRAGLAWLAHVTVAGRQVVKGQNEPGAALLLAELVVRVVTVGWQPERFERQQRGGQHSVTKWQRGRLLVGMLQLRRLVHGVTGGVTVTARHRAAESALTAVGRALLYHVVNGTGPPKNRKQAEPRAEMPAGMFERLGASE